MGKVVHRRMRLFVLSMILAGSLPAAEPSAPARTELSLLATGSVSIDAGGRVTAHQLDQPGKLPPAVTELAGGTRAPWLPSDGGLFGDDALADGQMALLGSGPRLLARPGENL